MTAPRTAKEPMWTRNFVVAFAVNIFIFYNAHLFLSTMAVYAVTKFAVGDAAGGTSASIFVVAAMLIRPLTGPIMARFSIKKLFVFSLAVFVATPVLLWSAPNFGLLLVERFIHGLAFGLASTIISAVAVAGLPGTRLAEGTSWYSTSTLIGVAMGPVAGLALMQAAGFAAVVWMATATSLLAVVGALILNTSAAHPKPREQQGDEHWITKFVSPEALPAAALGFVASAGYAAIVTYIGLFSAEREVPASFFFLIYGATALLVRLYTGPLMDRRGFFIVMFPALIIFAAGLFFLSQLNSILILVLAAILVGVGYGNVLSAGQTIAVTSVPKHRIGLATATFFLGIDAGIGLGPIILGLIVQSVGAGTMYLLLTVVMLVLAAVYALLHFRSNKTV